MYNVPILEVNEKLKDVSFKIPNYLELSFTLATGQEVEETTNFTNINCPYVILMKAKVQDRNNPEKETHLYSYLPFMPLKDDPVEASLRIAQWFMMHETQEFFFFQGERFKDPHTAQETNV